MSIGNIIKKERKRLGWSQIELAEKLKIHRMTLGRYERNELIPSIPAIWCNEFEGGRVWYSALGHNASCYAEPDYRAHVLGGLKWAAASPAAEPDKQ